MSKESNQTADVGQESELENSASEDEFDEQDIRVSHILRL